ncbi:MAG TPA: hypothetical protein VGC63_04755 [Solirubrobacterales bacterium]|jgi:hypothetical protein
MSKQGEWPAEIIFARKYPDQQPWILDPAYGSDYRETCRYIPAPEDEDEFTTCSGCHKPNGSTPDCDLCVLFRHEAGNETDHE